MGSTDESFSHTKVGYHPIIAKDNARLYQFDNKSTPRHLRGICAICGRKLERRTRSRLRHVLENHAPELYVKRVNATEVIVVQEGDKFMFPCAFGMISWQEMIQTFAHPIKFGKDLKRWKTRAVIIEEKGRHI